MLDFTQPPLETSGGPLISASILSADFGRMVEDCRDVLDKGADLLHIDVMDGHFAANLTMGVDMIRGLRKHLPDTYLDVHLMVERPGDYIESYAKAGANHFSFHLEVCKPFQKDGHDARVLIDAIHAAGMDAGMVVNPPTPIEALEEGLLPYMNDLQLVLVMSVIPGLSGQKFMPDVLEKTRWIHARRSTKTRLEMDGGLNMETSPQAVAAGVDVIVTASALFGAKDRQVVIDAMHQAGQ